METYEQRQRRQSDEALRALREKLMGRPSTSISVFDNNGRSHTFRDAQVDTVTIRNIGTIGGFKVLSFKTLDFRTINVVDVAYWIEDEA